MKTKFGSQGYFLGRFEFHLSELRLVCETVARNHRQEKKQRGLIARERLPSTPLLVSHLLGGIPSSLFRRSWLPFILAETLVQISLIALRWIEIGARQAMCEYNLSSLVTCLAINCLRLFKVSLIATI